MEENNSKIVVVTGATGFLAGHIIDKLLRDGYYVRGTVRDPIKTAGFQHLINIAKEVCGEEAEKKLTFFKADLLEEGSFDSACKGAHTVMHVASNLALSVKDVEKELVRPAVDGTLNVMKSCVKNGIKIFVVTSSIAAIENGIPKTPKPWKPYDESSNNTKCSPKWKAYSYSKVKALEAAVKFHSELKEEESFRLVSIHPSAIYGPQQNSNVTSSNQIVQVLITGEYPMFPQLWWPSCDVRDVAKAHVLAMTNEKAHGRYIVNNGHAWMKDYAEFLREKFPEAPVPKTGMPNFIFKMASWFDSRIDEATVKEQTLEGVEIDGTKIIKELDFEYKYEWKESIYDTVISFVKHNCGEKKKKWVEKYKSKN